MNSFFNAVWIYTAVSSLNILLTYCGFCHNESTADNKDDLALISKIIINLKRYPEVLLNYLPLINN